MTENYSFSAEIPDLMSLIINSIYSNKEIFLRELISNASDALDKFKYDTLTNNELANDQSDMKIKIIPNKIDNTITIEDDGIGMTKEDLINNLGTIAKSGTKSFLKSLKDKDNKVDLNMIGQFGVGFYSAYLVSDQVTVVTKNNNDKVYIWTSDAKSSFTIEETNDHDIKRGTRIICHLKDNMEEFLDETKLKEIIKKHSQYVNFPIELFIEKEVDVECDDEEVEEVEDGKVEGVTEESTEEPKEKKMMKKLVNEWELLNKQKPIWTRNSNEITVDEYKDFYKTIANPWEECSHYKHFSIEGNLELKGLLYIPKTKPYDMFQSTKELNNLKLYVKRVFITDDCKELVPEWLSFIKGVIDSDDLTLNVSRELLQQSKTLRLIKKQVVKKSIEMFQKIAENEDEYLSFYDNYQKHIKIGLHEDSSNRDKLSELLRFNTLNNQKTKISLDKYIENMKANAKIYYISGESIKSVINSPFLEKLKVEGHDVLLLTDSIDEYLIQTLKKYKEKELVSVSSNEFKLESDNEQLDQYKEEFKDLCAKFKEQLSDNVKDIYISTRIVDSPCCLVTDSNGYSANMQRIMKAQAMQDTEMMMNYMTNKSSMEINPKNKIIIELKNRLNKDKNDVIINDLIHLLHELSLLTSGFSLQDPSKFATNFTKMLSLGLAIDDLQVEQVEQVEH